MDDMEKIMEAPPEIDDTPAPRVPIEDISEGETKPEPKLTMRTCEDCGESFLGKGHQRFCPACRLVRQHAMRGATKAVCKICGKTFCTFKEETICQTCRRDPKNRDAWFESQGVTVIQGEHDPDEPPPVNRQVKGLRERQQKKKPIRPNLENFGVTVTEPPKTTRECTWCGAEFEPVNKEKVCPECREAANMNKTRTQKKMEAAAKAKRDTDDIVREIIPDTGEAKKEETANVEEEKHCGNAAEEAQECCKGETSAQDAVRSALWQAAGATLKLAQMLNVNVGDVTEAIKKFAEAQDMLEQLTEETRT